MRAYLFLICLIPLQVFSQLSVNQRTVDLGNIANFNNDTAYFIFTNSGEKNIYLLPVQPQSDYAVLCSGKTLTPGSSITIGIVYYTADKGKFNLEVPLFFSNSNVPYKLNVKGNIKSIRETAFSTCPSIENSAPLKAGQVPLNILVKDAETLEILTDLDVEVEYKKTIYKCVPGFEGSAYRCKVDYGHLEIHVSKKGYKDQRQSFNYNAGQYNGLVYLEKEDSIPELNSIPEIKVKKDSVKKLPETPEYVPVAYADSGFNSYRYRPNHLIFIVDISGSMKDSTKLYYLKRSMSELITMIRPTDYITLITYTSKVRVVFEHMSGLDKEVIFTALDTLSAGGGSNGSKSLVIANQLAEQYLIPDGNNQIFIATDGLLNNSSMSNEDLYKIATKSYRQHNIKLSTIGFGKDPKAIDFLVKLARHGRGNFLQINNLGQDLSTLREEVMLQSKK